MDLMSHLGILAILILIGYVTYMFEQDKEYEWFIPLGGATILWLIMEAFYWVVYFFFILH